MPHEDIPTVASRSDRASAVCCSSPPCADHSILPSAARSLLLLGTSSTYFGCPGRAGRKLFPSHRLHGWHRSGGVPASAQLVLAGFLIGLLLRRR
jgi:hypothetical protein